MNHESVANHYYVSSINLAEEVAQRMRDGEFDWKEFGGTHPAWNGHTYYAAAINRLFDLEWSGDVVKKTVRAHEVPEKPIDSYSYDKGVFADIRSAKQLNGCGYLTAIAGTFCTKTLPMLHFNEYPSLSGIPCVLLSIITFLYII